MARGDFREEINRSYWGDFIAIEQSIRSIHSALKDTLRQIRQSAGTVAASAGQVADGAQSLSQGASEQAGAVKDLSFTIGEIDKSARETADAVIEANHFVDQAGAQLGVSVDYVKDLNSAMEQISTSSREIGKIIPDQYSGLKRRDRGGAGGR